MFVGSGALVSVDARVSLGVRSGVVKAGVTCCIVAVGSGVNVSVGAIKFSVGDGVAVGALVKVSEGVSAKIAASVAVSVGVGICIGVSVAISVGASVSAEIVC